MSAAPRISIRRAGARWSLALLAALPSGAVPATVAAQGVVQAPPPREAGALNAALRRLAAQPRDVEALITAGNSSLALSDAVAASGFFARAAAIAPTDRRVLLGQARVALAQRRPVAALQAFAEAEAAGIRPFEMAADRALAYDLVGDNAAAQTLYRNALAADEGNVELRRRLALSLAISGNRTEFERMLYPMLRSEDRSAFRTRAFGLAILGRPDEAVAIADAMMPTDLALRMAPYLRYMPRLTKAQQAAAANLGAFPAAAEIGRDSLEIAGYASAGARIAANASASLTPTGAPLGSRPSAPAPAGPTVRVPAARPIAPGGTKPGVIGAAAIRPTVSAPPPTMAVATRAATQNTAAAAPAPVVVAKAPAVPGDAAPPPARLSLADAFADLTLAASPGAVAGAVDITALPAPRRPAPAAAQQMAPAKPAPVKPAAEKPKPKPKVEKPAEPARLWAQLGVGRNTAAFSFDWRKLAKQADGALDGKGPWAVKYGATNRMLAGPYASESAAKAAIKRLKDKGIAALPFSSDEGEKVTKIG